MISLPIFDLPTASAGGFLLRYVVPRTDPPQLVGPLSRKGLFTTLALGDVILGEGHGNSMEFCGQNKIVLMDTSSIPKVTDKLIVLISCQTARLLGPALIAAGAKSYLGWYEDLLWVMDAELASQPWKDEKLAQPVMMPIVNGLNALLDGKTAREAFDIQQEGFRASLAIEQNEFIASLIQWDLDGATLLGDGNAKVTARPKFTMPIPPPPFVFPIA